MLYSKTFSIVATCLMAASLSSCHPARMTDDEISAFSNDQLCEKVQRYPEDKRLISFMQGRGLACHPFQISCNKAGFKPANKEYGMCISNMASQRQDELAADAATRAAYAAALQSYKPPAAPVTTSCVGGYGSASCTTY